ncbi:MAG: hypothetical protein GX295_10340 [Syntrophomonadaceae bacterium]|nr:hypothetical protein [Syntrophomonadaceae bacterium]
MAKSGDFQMAIDNLNGSIRKPGLWLQANLVEPNQFLKNMELMGVEIQIDEGHQSPFQKSLSLMKIKRWHLIATARYA